MLEQIVSCEFDGKKGFIASVADYDYVDISASNGPVGAKTVMAADYESGGGDQTASTGSPKAKGLKPKTPSISTKSRDYDYDDYVDPPQNDTQGPSDDGGTDDYVAAGSDVATGSPTTPGKSSKGKNGDSATTTTKKGAKKISSGPVENAAGQVKDTKAAAKKAKKQSAKAARCLYYKTFFLCC